MMHPDADTLPLAPGELTPPPKPPPTGDLAALLRVLGDDTRLRIFALLTRAELCVCEIEDILGLSQSLVSNHLAVLRRAGLVKARRDEEDSRWISTAPIQRPRRPFSRSAWLSWTFGPRRATVGGRERCAGCEGARDVFPGNHISR